MGKKYGKSNDRANNNQKEGINKKLDELAKKNRCFRCGKPRHDNMQDCIAQDLAKSVHRVDDRQARRAVKTVDGSNQLIDGPLSVATEATTAGVLGGALTWKPASIIAGVTSNVTVSLSMGGWVPKQGVMEFVNRCYGKVVQGGKRATVAPAIKGGAYVQPTIIRCPETLPVCKEETFAPILYIIPIHSLDEAIELNNDVPQGLSSAIFTSNVRSAERFASATGRDCGIANINIGTSGAEIGGAFGGEKETGGGRESGSDAWKIYMRRQTTTVNWGTSLPLAQGITFG